MHTRMHALHALRGHCMLVHSRAKVLSVADTFDDTILDKGEPAAPIRDPLRPDLSKSSTTGQLVAPSCTRRQHLISPPGSPEGSGRACCKSENATRAAQQAPEGAARSGTESAQNKASHFTVGGGSPGIADSGATSFADYLLPYAGLVALAFALASGAFAYLVLLS